MARFASQVSRLLAGVLMGLLALELPLSAFALRARPAAEVSSTTAGLEETLRRWSPGPLTGPSTVPAAPAAGLEEPGRPEVPAERRALIFGIGNIGRGHLAPILAGQNNFDVIFADIAEAPIQAVNERPSYRVVPITTAGPEAPVTVEHVWGIPAQDLARVAAQGPRADWIFTAVGADNLVRLAPAIQQFIQTRMAAVRTAPLNLIFAENLPITQPQVEATRQAVVRGTDEAFRRYVDEHVGFVGAVVQLAVPPQTPSADRLLGVTVEGGEHELLVDQQAIRGPLEALPLGLRAVPNIQAYREKKLLIHNLGHAVLAYLLAARRGLTETTAAAANLNLAEGMDDPQIVAILRRAMTESAEALAAKYPELFASGQLTRYVEEFVGHDDWPGRFANVALGDTVERVGRDPRRKLAVGERLLGAAANVVAAGRTPQAITLGIAAALRYASEPIAQPTGLPASLQSVWTEAQRLAADDAAFRAVWERLVPAAGLEEREGTIAQAMAVAAWRGLVDAEPGSVGSQVLVFTEPATFDLAVLAARWGWAVAVASETREAHALRALLDQLRAQGAVRGAYAVGPAEAQRFRQGYSKVIEVTPGIRPWILTVLGLRPEDLPPAVAQALEATSRYLPAGGRALDLAA